MFLKIVACYRLSIYWERGGKPFRRQSATFVHSDRLSTCVRRLRLTGAYEGRDDIPFDVLYRLKKAYNSVDGNLMWTVLACYGVPPPNYLGIPPIPRRHAGAYAYG